MLLRDMLPPVLLFPPTNSQLQTCAHTYRILQYFWYPWEQRLVQCSLKSDKIRLYEFLAKRRFYDLYWPL